MGYSNRRKADAMATTPKHERRTGVVSGPAREAAIGRRGCVLETRVERLPSTRLPMSWSGCPRGGGCDQGVSDSVAGRLRPLTMVGPVVAFVLSPAAFACLFIAFAAVGIILTLCRQRLRESPSTRAQTTRGEQRTARGDNGRRLRRTRGPPGGGAFLLPLLLLLSSRYAVSIHELAQFGPKPSAAQLDRWRVRRLRMSGVRAVPSAIRVGRAHR